MFCTDFLHLFFKLTLFEQINHSDQTILFHIGWHLKTKCVFLVGAKFGLFLLSKTFSWLVIMSHRRLSFDLDNFTDVVVLTVVHEIDQGFRKHFIVGLKSLPQDHELGVRQLVLGRLEGGVIVFVDERLETGHHGGCYTLVRGMELDEGS